FLVDGEAKTDGAWWAALSDRARDDLQAEIDQCGRDFVADVIAGRPQLTVDEVLATQAAVYMGHHDEPARSALSLKLVDDLASEEAAFAALRDQVSGSTPSPAPGSIATTAEAPRGRASASAEKEGRMAIKPKAGGKPTAKTPLATARAALARAQADVARLTAEDQSDPEAEDDQTDVTAEGGEDMEPEAEGEDTDTDAEGDDAEEADAEAKRISGSPEAQAHPGLALAAINSGQSFAQFQANVKAAGTGGGNRLVSTLAGSRRLGADVASKADTAAKLDPKAIYGARKARARKG
ncbi:MAG: hypothetical protein K2X61_03820, partial [Caulobacteraceae bacterium]|nr:hypothetical protein [Caulobacteraceae bacterium]